MKRFTFKFLLGFLWSFLLFSDNKIQARKYVTPQAIILEAESCAKEGNDQTILEQPTSSKRFLRQISVNAGKAKCGVGPEMPRRAKSRIVGGHEAVKNSWPSMVALLYNNEQFCGGVLIDSLHVVSAAHCFEGMTSRNVTRITVAIGMHRIKPRFDAHIIKKVFRLTYHRNFNPVTYHNDVALLRLESPVIFTLAISPICLPPFRTPVQYDEREAVIVGWGELEDGGRQPDALQQVAVEIISNARCKSIYGRVAPGGITDTMLCATHPGRDSCSGDSGGPLFVQSEPEPNSAWFLVGIISWGVGCADPKYPGVYTRVSSFTDWIKKYVAWPELTTE